MAAESMVQDAGWTMMDIGKRIERALSPVRAAAVTITAKRGPVVEQNITDSVLVVCESSVIYRRRNLGQASVAAIARLLLFDGRNPDRWHSSLTGFARTFAPCPVRPGPRDRNGWSRVSARLRRIDPGPRTGGCSRPALPTRRIAVRAYDVARALRRHHPDPTLAAGRYATALGSRPKACDAMTNRRYRITHHTQYRYSDVVTNSYGRGHLTPRDTAGQRCLSFDLDIDPEPADRSTSLDGYGNISTYFQVTRPHRELSVLGRSIVEVAPPPAGVIPPARRSNPGSRPARTVPAACWPRISASTSAPGDHRRRHRVRRAGFAPGRPLIEALRDLNARIFADFTYRSGSTTVSTQVTQVLEAREGVCQDFARLAVACLRANSLAASYVSGYLATDPPPGRERVFGIDATHAWAAVGLPATVGSAWTRPTTNSSMSVMSQWGGAGLLGPAAVARIIYTDSECSVIDVSVDVEPLTGDPAGA